MNRRSFLGAAALVTAALAGCLSSAEVGTPPETPEPRDGQVTFAVVNQDGEPHDATLRVEGGSGTVTVVDRLVVEDLAPGTSLRRRTDVLPAGEYAVSVDAGSLGDRLTYVTDECPAFTVTVTFTPTGVRLHQSCSAE